MLCDYCLLRTSATALASPFAVCNDITYGSHSGRKQSRHFCVNVGEYHMVVGDLLMYPILYMFHSEVNVKASLMAANLSNYFMLMSQLGAR